MIAMGMRRAFFPDNWTSPSARGPLSGGVLRPYCVVGSWPRSRQPLKQISDAQMKENQMTANEMTANEMTPKLRLRYNDERRGKTLMDVNDKSPDFSTTDENGKEVALKDFRGKTVVLYFYPKADTPGCTKEACGFRDTILDYTKAKVVVFGVSPDPVGDVKKFHDKFHLNFPLLADADHAVCEKYGVWQEKTNYGKKYMGVVRTTFVI